MADYEQGGRPPPGGGFVFIVAFLIEQSSPFGSAMSRGLTRKQTVLESGWVQQQRGEKSRRG